MHFGKSSPPVDLAKKTEGDLQSWERDVEVRANELRELFVTLKTDLLDHFLQPGSGHVTEDDLRILREQIDHVVRLAQKVHFSELEHAFLAEEQVLDRIEDLLHDYPSANVSSSADLRAQLEHLRALMSAQQKLMFDRHEILTHEKQQLINILGQVRQMENITLPSSIKPLPDSELV